MKINKEICNGRFTSILFFSRATEIYLPKKKVKNKFRCNLYEKILKFSTVTALKNFKCFQEKISNILTRDHTF